MPCISGILFPLPLHLELMPCLCNPTYLAEQQTIQCTQAYYKSEVRATDLEDSKSWKAAEDYWLKLQVEKGWACCLKTQHSNWKHWMQAKSKGFPRTDSNTKSAEGGILITPPPVSLCYLQGTMWGDALKQCLKSSTAHFKDAFLWQSLRHCITKTTTKSHVWWIIFFVHKWICPLKKEISLH